jgi:transposase
MSMRPEPIRPVPEETACVAHAAFPKGSTYIEMRDVLGTVYEDENFTQLFELRGRPRPCALEIGFGDGNTVRGGTFG